MTTCKLGLNNPKEHGGDYRGENIAKTLGNIRHQLENDGYIGKGEEDNQPNIWVIFSENILTYFDAQIPKTSRTSLKGHGVPDGGGPMVSDLFEHDAMYDEIKCGGFGIDGGGWTDECKDCPYLTLKNGEHTSQPSSSNRLPPRNLAFDSKKAKEIRHKMNISQLQLTKELEIDVSLGRQNITKYELGLTRPSNPPKGSTAPKYMQWLKEHGYNPFNL